MQITTPKPEVTKILPSSEATPPPMPLLGSMVLGLPSRPHRVGASVPFLGASRLSHTGLPLAALKT